MAKCSSENSMRGACYANEVSRSSLQFLGGAGVGTAYFVDGTSGSDATSRNGKTWKSAFKTIAVAVAACAAGDTIFIKGSFSEAVTCTKADVRFIGVGTGPAQATWTMVSATNSTTDGWCLKIGANNVLVENIKFRPPAYKSAGVPTGIYLDASSDYSIIRNCRFQGRTGSYKAIYGVTPIGNIVIDGCEFIYMNTATHGCAIYMPPATGLACSNWQIKNCVFNSCLADIDIDGRTCLLDNNKHFIVGLAANGTFASAVTVQAIDLSGTDTGANLMTNCTLGGIYNLATYKPGAVGDVWMGNKCSIVADKAPNGLSVLVPAA